eukprot:gnl/TRDRNA2_/TRDRNA2_184237_c0_seq1.p1 gnl/TRDRNA2_/TRDRNA2_184237_c0~~gnl/TRDRNA2_/TRDRNA2_184237_c0_seq1.p1  ORF type:complete len:333 (+),score=73.44 gnl/TRDRNA2_/TRDRNA2_184237_c0_seq1:51-1049(+)
MDATTKKVLGEQPSQLVFGTMERDDPEEFYGATLAALKVGYRAFDLAEHYKTIPQVGRALKDSGVSREELTVVAKYDGMPVGDYAEVKARVTAMLAKAQLDSFDLLLMHYPADAASTDLNGEPDALATAERWVFFESHAAEAWANMARLQRDGLATAVGLSNCYQQHVAVLRPVAEKEGVPIAANQIFVDAAHPEEAYVAELQAMGIAVMAYRPLVFLGVMDMAGMLDALAEAAADAGCDSAQQLVLSWLRGRGVHPVSSSSSVMHIAANFAAPAELAPVGKAAALAALPTAEQREMINMYGGLDEYAAAFSRMMAPAPVSEPDPAAAKSGD